MNKIITLIVLMILIPAFSAAAEEKVSIKVSGVVCSFCAQGIRKSFEETGTTKNVSVNLDQQEVTLEFQKDKNLSDKEIKEILENAGYNFIETKRSQIGDKQ